MEEIVESKKTHILFGFKSAGAQEKILTYLKSFGYEVQSNARFSKPLILDYVRNNKNCDTVILKEFLDGGGAYEAEELAELTEENEVNVVVVLDSYHRGREYMKTLLDAGITSAIFPEYKDAVNPQEIARLVIKKRSRKEARYYYRIQNLKLDLQRLSYEQYSEYYQYLMNENYGVNGTDRFLTIMHWLTPARASYFIKNLPDEVITQLLTTAEFYDVLAELRKKGFLPLPHVGKKPKKILKGIPENSFREKAIAQFGPPPDITVRTMSAVKNTEDVGNEDMPEEEEVILSKKETSALSKEQEDVFLCEIDEEDISEKQMEQEKDTSDVEMSDAEKIKQMVELFSGMSLQDISNFLNNKE